jgi:hypothetical protein
MYSPLFCTSFRIYIHGISFQPRFKPRRVDADLSRCVTAASVASRRHGVTAVRAGDARWEELGHGGKDAWEQIRNIYRRYVRLLHRQIASRNSGMGRRGHCRAVGSPWLRFAAGARGPAALGAGPRLCDLRRLTSLSKRDASSTNQNARVPTDRSRLFRLRVGERLHGERVRTGWN